MSAWQKVGTYSDQGEPTINIEDALIDQHTFAGWTRNDGVVYELVFFKETKEFEDSNSDKWTNKYNFLSCK
jgi:hypothetical protein